ncbi:hypothetical protein LEP1GSC012_0234 [Leptospira interrogans serovar Valbuzzi str. Valbuzzi]|nr:hypothetical protein LEP1GSC012_0234 [Leptospira interrogans serovar Valbuzzi str. Valbuzzi]
MLWFKILIPTSFAELEFEEVGFTGFLSGERGFEELESEGAFVAFSSFSFTFELGFVFVTFSSFTFLLSKLFSKSNRRFMEFCLPGLQFVRKRNM